MGKTLRSRWRYCTTFDGNIAQNEMMTCRSGFGVHPEDHRGQKAFASRRQHCPQKSGVTMCVSRSRRGRRSSLHSMFVNQSHVVSPSLSQSKEQLKQIFTQLEHMLKWQQSVANRLHEVCYSLDHAMQVNEEGTHFLHATTEQDHDGITSDTSKHAIMNLQQELKELRSYVLLFPTILSRDNHDAPLASTRNAD